MTPRLAAWSRGLNAAEDALLALAVLATAVLPVLDLALRQLGSALPGASDYVQKLTLWVAFLGAMRAAREGQHLSLSPGAGKLPGWPGSLARALSALATVAVAAALAWASWGFVVMERGTHSRLADVWPLWPVLLVMPLAFAVVALRAILHAANRWTIGGGIAGLLLVGWVGLTPAAWAQGQAAAAIALLLVTAPAGTTIYALLGGTALLLFLGDGIEASAVPIAGFELMSNSVIPTIPIFTLAGFILAEGRASQRLLRLFRAWVGWLPGGLAMVAVVSCAFFTTFTGASGVTILALGGPLLPVLLAGGYRERFSVGLLTSVGAVGLLFPPSLAVILYGVMAQENIQHLFIAGILPGALLVLATCGLGVATALRQGAERPRFSAPEALAALWAARYEVLLPVVTLVGIFGGFATLIEAAALTAVYVLVIELVLRRELKPRDLPPILGRCGALLGGVFIILVVSMGLSSYLVDAQVATAAADWVESHVASRAAFLLLLNLFLLLVGCLMDIFGAIVVVVPLILPIAKVYGIDPMHLGIVFLVNLQLGYLTPPVGMNLFLASFRFGRPLLTVARDVLPFLLLMAVVVALVTAFPQLSAGVLSWWLAGRP